uniref:Uncharacterized protein n=1 Tax=Arundo donax TaxID=35708 RepID=A0A0A9A496_ARUDO
MQMEIRRYLRENSYMMPCPDFGRLVHLYFPVSGLLSTSNVSFLYVVICVV